MNFEKNIAIFLGVSYPAGTHLSIVCPLFWVLDPQKQSPL